MNVHIKTGNLYSEISHCLYLTRFVLIIELTQKFAQDAKLCLHQHCLLPKCYIFECLPTL